MRTKVEKVVRNCVPCILAERKHGKKEELLHPIEKGEASLDTFHLDYLGPLPSTRKKYRHILVIVDAFTKFVWFYAVRTEFLGIRGGLFRTAVRHLRLTTFRNIAEQREYISLSRRMPKANGQVERVNRTITPLLTK